ncbi:MAG: class I SAM-dependent methyltransferase [bacterium]
MPTSQWSQIGVLVDALVRLEPRTLLDVGVGNGKWGFLAREYLEVFPGKVPYGTRTVRVEGIEAHEPYLGAVHERVYDRIHRGEALEVLAKLDDGSFDVVLLIDILEHMTREVGLAVLEHATRVGRVAIVSVPRDFKERDEFLGNRYEQHVTPWSMAQLRAAGARTFLVNPASHIAVLSRAPLPAALRVGPRIKRWVRLWARGRLY